jgi:hypothetical protein
VIDMFHEIPKWSFYLNLPFERIRGGFHRLETSQTANHLTK